MGALAGWASPQMEGAIRTPARGSASRLGSLQEPYPIRRHPEVTKPRSYLGFVNRDVRCDHGWNHRLQESAT